MSRFHRDHSRREFVKTALTAGAGALLPAVNAAGQDRRQGRIDVHHHCRTAVQGGAGRGPGSDWSPEKSIEQHSAARRQPRSLDQPHEQQDDDRTERRRRQRHGQRRAPGRRRTTSRPPRSTVSKSTRGGRTGSTARSRTTAHRRAQHEHRRASVVGGGESGYIAVDPRNANIIYAGNYGGTLSGTDRTPASAKTSRVYADEETGQRAPDMKYRFQWNAPISLSPHNPDIVYTTSQYVHRSRTAARRGSASARTSRATTRRSRISPAARASRATARASRSTRPFRVRGVARRPPGCCGPAATTGSAALAR